MDFIKRHLIEKIKNEVELKRQITKECNFYYFDEPIKDKVAMVNRVSRFTAFGKEEIVGLSWYSLSGQTLLKIYDKIKNNDFFYYTLVDGKSYKARLKKNNVKTIE